MQADEEDSFSIKENFYELFSDRVPNSSLTNDSMDHVHYIEKVLKSNLRYIFYKITKIQLFYDETEFNRLFREFKKESKRLLKHVSTEDIYSYLSSCTVIDEKIPNEIEKSFGVIFKNRLLSTRSEISENRFDLTSLLHQWDEISKRFTEDHVIQYYIYVKKCEF